jgi:hypothetical protein
VPQSKGWQFATPWDSFDFGFTHYQALPNGVDVYLDSTHGRLWLTEDFARLA